MKKKIKIDEKINFLINFCKENKMLWLNRENKDFYLAKIKSEKEKQIIEKDLEKAIQYYEYVRIRKSKNNLREEDIQLLYNAGIGGVFAFSETTKQECKEIALKYNIKLQNLKSLVAHFGSIEEFKKSYIEYILKNGEVEEKETIEKYIKILSGELVEIFDLSNPNMCFDYSGLAKLNDIPKYTILIDSNTLLEETERALKLLPEDWENILREYYGIGVEKVNSGVKLANRYKCTHQNISQKVDRAKEVFLKKRKSLKELGIIEKQEEREDMLNYFLDNCSIFYIDKTEKIVETEKDNTEEETEKEENSIFEYIKKEYHEQQKNAILTPIERLNFSLRATNALKRNGVLYVEELARKSFKEISEFSGIGKRTYDEIISAVDENGNKIFNEELNIESDLERAIKSLKQAYEELNKIIEQCRENNNKSIEKTYIRKRHSIAKALKEYGIEVEEK